MAVSLRRTVAPALTPVSLAEVKAHLRVTGTAEDALIGVFLQSAVDHLDAWVGILGRALVTQTWELALDEFAVEIRLPLGLVQSVEAVEYRDTAGLVQTVPSASYVVDILSPEARIVLAPNATWPMTLDAINAVTVRFVCGYGAAAAVPSAIKAAILLMVADLYENREGQTAKALTPNATVDRLLSPYRTYAA